MRNRKSVDTTLGFSVLDGLSMGRPGTLDPGVVLYLFQGLGLTAKQVETILYKKSVSSVFPASATTYGTSSRARSPLHVGR